MRRVSLALLLASLLSGCMTSEERAAAVVAADDDECQFYGAQPWTPAYTRCRALIFHQRQEVADALVGPDMGPAPVAIAHNGMQVLMAPPPIAPGPTVIHSRY
ncbi:MAG TPA: hypothetical protein VKS78_11235 [Roseiarcus sp.]|nr:hypothetical protein [Roseiarcus sp.]